MNSRLARRAKMAKKIVRGVEMSQTHWNLGGGVRGAPFEQEEIWWEVFEAETVDPENDGNHGDCEGEKGEVSPESRAHGWVDC